MKKVYVLLISLLLLSSCNIPFTNYSISGPKPVGYYSRYEGCKGTDQVIVRSEREARKLIHYGVDSTKIVIVPLESLEIDSSQVEVNNEDYFEENIKVIPTEESVEAEEITD